MIIFPEYSVGRGCWSRALGQPWLLFLSSGMLQKLPPASRGWNLAASKFVMRNDHSSGTDEKRMGFPSKYQEKNLISDSQITQGWKVFGSGPIFSNLS